MPFSEQNLQQFKAVFGHNLLAEMPNFVPPTALIVTMEDIWKLFGHQLPKSVETYFVHSLEQTELEDDLKALAGIRSVVGLGGGQAVDVAKYFAWRLNLPLFQFPTSLSVDAVFGHRAAVRRKGIVNYVGWAVPETVYLDRDMIRSAPLALNTGGVGDILCFTTGVLDWRYAYTRGRCEPRWNYDKTLANISMAKAKKTMSCVRDIYEMTDVGIELLVDGLNWGGSSFHGAGWNPRHIEGIEHYIFYALEAHTGKSFFHGQAVCLGIVLGTLMHEKRVYQLLDVMTYLQIDIRPSAMGISWGDVWDVLEGLSKFVVEHELPYGIAHDFELTWPFQTTTVDQIEDAYSRSW